MKHLLLLLLSLSLHAQTVSINTVQFGDGLTVGAASAVNSLTNGLIAYWTFDSLTGSQYTNSVAGSPSLNTNGLFYIVPGIIGNAFCNTTNSGNLTTNSTTTLNPTNGTFSWWSIRTNFFSQESYILSIGNRNIDIRYQVGSRRFDIYCYTNETGQNIFQTTFPNTNLFFSWTFYTITFDKGTNVVLYTNGIAMNTNNMNGIKTNNTGNFILGGSGITTLQGYIDDFRIYNRVLSSNEIYALSRTNTFLAQ